MGVYFNPPIHGFEESLRSEIYVDKSGMIAYTNKVLGTKQKYICISRPRRFGKTMAAEMLNAYYNRGCVSGHMFTGLTAAMGPSYQAHLNQYNVIFLNMQQFLSESSGIENMITSIQESIITDLQEILPDIKLKSSLTAVLENLFRTANIPFIFIIDEWDCIFREYRIDKASQRIYLDFLRNLLKDRAYVALAYMTGILPIKKYGSHSALNMFNEFAMTNPGPLAEYVGFTEAEVKNLCERYQMDYEDMAKWYDGYCFHKIKSIYSPKSVVDSLLFHCFDNYWSNTESYEALGEYIKINFDGLKDAIIQLLAGAKLRIDIRGFTNDMVTFISYQDVLTLLIHLGYLGYDFETREVFIPNKEISDEFVSAIKSTGWNEIITSLNESERLLQSTWRGDALAVAQAIEKAHNETSIIKYNDENALSCVISIAYYSARQYYSIVREMPAGKGFADLVFLPRKGYLDKPVMIMELKWDNSADSAVRQIEDKRYTDIIKDNKDNVLLIGINYDKNTKLHACSIKRFVDICG